MLQVCQHNWELSFKETKGGIDINFTYHCLLCNEIKKIEERIFKDMELPGKWSSHTNVERGKYGADILQPYKKDGQPNKDFIKVYGKTKEAYGLRPVRM